MASYTSMLKNFPDLPRGTVANAQYWIGWGSYQLKDYEKAVEILELPLKSDASTYGFKAGMLMIYCHYATKNKTGLQKAVDIVTDLDKGEKIQNPIYRWLGVQCFNAGEMQKAARYLSLGTTSAEPRQTPKNYWKMLGTTQVETGQYKEALVAIQNFLDVAEEPFWKAEAFLDQAKAHLGLEDLVAAKTSAEAGLQLRPKGRVNAELRLALGDIAYNNKDYAAAANAYVIVVEFAGDKEIRPEALFKTYQSLQKKGDEEQARTYLNMLNKEFPDYLKKGAKPAVSTEET